MQYLQFVADHWIEIGIAIAALTAASHVLSSAAHALNAWSLKTKAKWDDKATSWLVVVADGLVSVLAFVAGLLPRVAPVLSTVTGKKLDAPATPPANPYDKPAPPAGGAA